MERTSLKALCAPPNALASADTDTCRNGGLLGHRLLLVDDDKEHCEALATALTLLGYHVEYTTSAREALDRVGRETFAAILTDLSMSEMNGLELCARILGTRPDIPVIVISGNGTLDAAISAMRAGAYDFLVKPIDLDLLTMNVRRAVHHHLLQAEVKELQEASLERAALRGLVGGSIEMRRMCDLVARVAASDISVVIEGETGTGKELVARALHAAGARRRGPFVALNCSAIPPTLLESELFGSRPGTPSHRTLSVTSRASMEMESRAQRFCRGKRQSPPQNDTEALDATTLSRAVTPPPQRGSASSGRGAR